MSLRARSLLMFWMLGAACAAGAQAATIDFVPPSGTEQGRDVSIQATFNSGIPAAYAYLFVRPIGQSSFLPVVLRVNGNQLQGEIPSSFLVAPGVEYYLSVVDIDNETFTFPPTAPTLNPLTLAISPKPTGFEIHPVFPYQGAVAHDALGVFHFEFNSIGGGLDPKSFTISLDDVDISSACQFEDGEVFCYAENLPRGAHTVHVSAQNRRQDFAPPIDYRFERSAKKDHQFALHGSAVVGMSSLDVVRESNNPLFMPFPSNGDRVYPEVQLRGNGAWGARQLTVSVDHAGLDRQEQPSPDHYHVQMKGPHDVLDVGDFQNGWTDLGLSPLNLRGVHGALSSHSKAIEVEAVGAQTRRAISFPQFNSGVYAQYLYGTNATFSFKRNALRLYALKGKDDIDSLPTDTLVNPVGGDVRGAELTLHGPADLELVQEWATSHYQPDLRSSRSQSGDAWQSKLEQELPRASWSAAYRDVAPNYVSLGNSYLQSDYRGLDLQGSARLIDNKFFLSSNLQRYRDNTRHQKESTFTLLRHQTNATIQTLPRWPSLLLGFGDQHQSVNSVTNPIQNRTRNWTGGLNQSFALVTLGYVYGLSQYRDFSPLPLSHSFDNRSHTVNFSAARRGASISASVGQQVSEDFVTGNRTTSLTASGRVAGSFGKHWSGELSHSRNRGRDNQSSLHNDQNSTVGKLKWSLSESRFWQAAFEDVSYSNVLSPGTSYRETKTTVSYGFDF